MPEADIRELMQHFLFNVFTIQNRAELGRTGTTDMLKTEMLLHSQFVLGYDSYRDNNNYIRHNSLKFTTKRWTLTSPEFENDYLDQTPNPNYISEPYFWQLNVTRDGGETFKFETYRMVFGIYYFLSEDKVEQFKNLSSITEVIAIIEGVASLVLMFVAIVPSYINQKQLEAKTIRHCFFDVDEKVEINSDS